MDRSRADAVVVLRLWTEPHDRRPRARIFRPEDEDGVVVVGTDAILDLVRRTVERMSGDDRDGGATPE